MTERDLSAVNRFADLMRVKLRENDHKGHWEHCDPMWLFSKLRDEVQELAEELDASMGPVGTSPFLIARECADVAAFAMMIADVVGALPYEPEHAATCQDCGRWTARIKELEARLALVASVASGTVSAATEHHVARPDAPDLIAGATVTEEFLRRKIARLKDEVRALRNGTAKDLITLNTLAEDERDAAPAVDEPTLEAQLAEATGRQQRALADWERFSDSANLAKLDAAYLERNRIVAAIRARDAAKAPAVDESEPPIGYLVIYDIGHRWWTAFRGAGSGRDDCGWRMDYISSRPAAVAACWAHSKQIAK
jgi:hypothetical protein